MPTTISQPKKDQSEILFIAEDAGEGGVVAHDASESIFVEADDLEGLEDAIRDAVACHFGEDERPRLIRLHYVRQQVFAPG